MHSGFGYDSGVYTVDLAALLQPGGRDAPVVGVHRGRLAGTFSDYSGTLFYCHDVERFGPLDPRHGMVHPGIDHAVDFVFGHWFTASVVRAQL